MRTLIAVYLLGAAATWYWAGMGSFGLFLGSVWPVFWLDILMNV